MLNSLLNLLYPELCLTCRQPLFKYEKHICLLCESKLPFTGFHLQRNNPLEKTFWGRLPFEAAFSMLYFNNKGLAQKLLHQLKYQGNKELGAHLGLMYSQQLKNSNTIKNIAGVVAVPLHISKYRKRGYNQSEWFANGLCEGLNIPNLSHAVKRNIATETQTQKNRLERWKNVSSIFTVVDTKAISNKHILLVDDVITTGATLESCAASLLQVEGVKISLASVAAVL